MNTPPPEKALRVGFTLAPLPESPGNLLRLLALNLQLTGLRQRGAQLEDLAPTTRDALKDLFTRATAPERAN